MDNNPRGTTRPPDLVQLQPRDGFNLELESQVHPPGWINPTPNGPYHLVVIGAGTAGLVTAAGAAGLGARVALIERELMGGDCLNVGCVPSKALISSARAAAHSRGTAMFGVRSSDGARVDFAAVMERMRRLRAQISPMDSAHRFSQLGVDVYFGSASFADSSSILIETAGGMPTKLKFKKAVLATGARASAPEIPGLDTVQYLTNESLFSLTELPPRLGILGAGPIGVEMAQAFARFGSEVSLFDRSRQILAREDSDAAGIVQSQLLRDGVKLILESQIQQVRQASEHTIQLVGQRSGQSFEIEVDQLLVAVGRAPNTAGLNLELAGVAYDKHGVQVNDFLQTTNPKIYAAGDICSSLKFTHAADFQARIVIQNSLFALGPFGRKRNSRLLIPWATYTSPEIAHVGMYPQEAEAAGIEIDTYLQTFEHLDRAILEGQEQGFVKVHTRKGTDRMVGATIVADHAGDLISEISLAMTHKLGLSKIGSTIHPYPTQAEAIRKLGDQFNKTKLTALSKWILSWLRRFNVGQ